jgi:hypothetical protein
LFVESRCTTQYVQFLWATLRAIGNYASVRLEKLGLLEVAAKWGQNQIIELPAVKLGG